MIENILELKRVLRRNEHVYFKLNRFEEKSCSPFTLRIHTCSFYGAVTTTITGAHKHCLRIIEDPEHAKPQIRT